MIVPLSVFIGRGIELRSKVFDPREARYKALCLFWEKGYAQASMSEIVSVMGISRSSFYDTYGDKRQLYRHVLADFGELGDMASIVLREDKPIRQLLRNFFDISFKQTQSSLSSGCLLVNTVLEQQAHDPELVAEASVCLSRIERSIQQALENAQRNRELRTDASPQALAALYMTIIKGLRVGAREGKDIEALQAQFESALNLLEICEESQ